MAPAVEPLLQSLFPADVFVATLDNRDHAFAPAVSVATSHGQVLPAGHQGLTTPCEVCGAALGAHALAVRWKRDARVPAGHNKQRKRSRPQAEASDALRDALALLEATRKLASRTSKKNEVDLNDGWLVRLGGSCWRNLPRLAPLGVPENKLHEVAASLHSRDSLRLTQKLDEAYFSLFYEARSRRLRIDQNRWSPCAFYHRAEREWYARRTSGVADDDNDDADANDKTPPVAPSVAQHPLYGVVMTQDHQAETDFFRLWLARMHEQLRRGENLANFDSMLKERRRVPKDEWAGRGRPPLQTLSAQKWFDLMRDWPAHIYAYAVPTRSALKEIVNLGSIVEVGAGTGYWAYHLRTMGANVVAADIAPLEMDTSTSVGSTGKKRNSRGGAHTRANEYHGQLPAYTRIEAMPRGRKGGSLDASWAQRDALFLCYPPPGTPMAENALADFQGQHVAVVGEWIGTTATQPFEVSLQREFILSKTVHLPNWPNTAYTLTIWRRRDKAIAAPQPVPLQALTCEVCASALGQGAELRRCALTRAICFCSTRCFHRGKSAWHLELLARGLPCPDLSNDDTLFMTAFDLLLWPFVSRPGPTLQEKREARFQNYTVPRESSFMSARCGKQLLASSNARRPNRKHQNLCVQAPSSADCSTDSRIKSKGKSHPKSKRPLILHDESSKKTKPRPGLKRRATIVLQEEPKKRKPKFAKTKKKRRSNADK